MDNPHPPVGEMPGHPAGSGLTTDEMNHLVQALGRFAFGMLTTFVQCEDNIPHEVAQRFKQHIVDWTSIASEFIDVDALIEEATDA